MKERTKRLLTMRSLVGPGLACALLAIASICLGQQRVTEDFPYDIRFDESSSTETPDRISGPGEKEKPSAEDSASLNPDLVNYVIGPEDLLEIEVFGLPELSRTVRVANDGTISLALLGRVQAAGYTTVQLREELESRWGEKYLTNPQVTVFVKDFNAQPVSVIGAVEKPGIYYLSGPRTLIDMLSTAGGLAKRVSAAAGRTLYVTRKGGFEGIQLREGMRLVAPEKLEIEIRRLLYSEDPALNIGIRPFDTIAVSKADVVYVVGDVKKPGGFMLEDREHMTVLQAVALAEGLAGTAAKGSARIIRRSEEGSRTEIPVDLGKILNGREPDVPMAANDILFVPSSTAKVSLQRAAEAAVGTISGILIYRR